MNNNKHFDSVLSKGKYNPDAYTPDQAVLYVREQRIKYKLDQHDAKLFQQLQQDYEKYLEKKRPKCQEYQVTDTLKNMNSNPY